MTTEIKQCQNCKSQFTIEPEDFQFYEKMKVPPPTFCPECRMRRRLVWRNEHTLYKKKCSAPGHAEDVISTYSPESPIVVYDHEYWYSDAWDPLSYGKEYDFSKPFFEQYRSLLYAVPHLALFDSKSVNSSYCNITVEHKNCYLVTAGWGNEDSLYTNRNSFCKDTVDSYVCHKTEFGYENIYVKNSYQTFFSQDSENCNNSYFLFDCRNCSHCVCSANLRNKQYYIFNQPYTKEDYAKKLEELRIETTTGIDVLRKKFIEIRARAVHRYARLINTADVIGDNVENSKNCKYCFDMAGGSENCKYCHWATYGLRESYDTGPGTGGNSELTYEGISIGVTNARCKFGVVVWYSHDVQYGFNCQDSHDLFGCVGIRKKQYCILNKQYSKKEYEILLPKIVKHMNDMPYIDKLGRNYGYGEFFPVELSPYAYNEAVSQDYLPLDEHGAKAFGSFWRPQSEKQYAINLKAADIPESIEGVSDNITDEIIECEHKGACNEQCSTAFRIVPNELRFYRRMNLPLPRLCPKCRHYRRLAQRNPLKLWHRQCMCDYQVFSNTVKHSHHPEGRCHNEFETSYAPDRPEIVYCESCYNLEIA